MDQFLQQLGISQELFNYFILPLLIFLARIFDVSIATIRIIFVMSGKKLLAPLFGFFESFIWLIAIGQIIQNIDNFYSYIAFAMGFAAGTLVGMLIEEKLALGSVVVRVITRVPALDLIRYLKRKKFQYSNIQADGKEGPVNILFLVIKRGQMKSVVEAIKRFNPRAFYTIEGVKSVSEGEVMPEKSRYYGLRLFNLKRR